MNKFGRLYNVGYGSGHPFNVLADKVIDTSTMADAEDMTSNDALLLHGGTDIGTWMYNHPTSKETYAHAAARDAREWQLLRHAIAVGATIIGICRGGQMICAAAGGFLIQDVDGHLGDHNVVTMDGEIIAVNSIHHQMMCWEDDKVESELMAWCPQPRSKQYIYRDDKLWQPPDNWVEPEYVVFPRIRAHAIQWHPEMMSSNAPANKFVINCIKNEVFA